MFICCIILYLFYTLELRVAADPLSLSDSLCFAVSVGSLASEIGTLQSIVGYLPHKLNSCSHLLPPCSGAAQGSHAKQTDGRCIQCFSKDKIKRGCNHFYWAQGCCTLAAASQICSLEEKKKRKLIHGSRPVFRLSTTSTIFSKLIPPEPQVVHPPST